MISTIAFTTDCRLEFYENERPEGRKGSELKALRNHASLQADRPIQLNTMMTFVMAIMMRRIVGQ